MSQTIPPRTAIEYPGGDGERLAKNDPQRHAIHYAFGAQGLYFAARFDVYVSADLLLYYEPGNPRVSVAPDVFVGFGVEDRMRMNYKVWEEGKGPDFVLEVTSPSTWREDVESKPSVYAGLGVRENFLDDPTGEHLTPRLQGYRLAGGEYGRLSAVDSIDRTLKLPSEVLGLELRARGDAMRFRDPATRAGSAQPRRGAHRASRTSRCPPGRSCCIPGGDSRTTGRRGACRGARGTPSPAGSLTRPSPARPVRLTAASRCRGSASAPKTETRFRRSALDISHR